ncbi:MAG: DUF6445 family protein [Nocardioides sp.]
MRPPQWLQRFDEEVCIIDDFYVNPDPVRDLALRTEFIDFGGKANFPGAESAKAFGTGAHCQMFETALGASIHWDPKEWVFGKFRLSRESDSLPTHVHLDSVDWTAVVYLTPEATPSGGPVFYGSLEFGVDRVPSRERLRDLGFESVADFDLRYVLPNTSNPEKWSEIGRVTPEYNRCVLFRGGRLFHGIGQTFGQEMNEARLTQNFFFMEEAKQAISSRLTSSDGVSVQVGGVPDE